MVCSEGCGRGSACAGSAAAGHSRLLAEGAKEEEKREEASLSSAFGEGGREDVSGGWRKKEPLPPASAATDKPASTATQPAPARNTVQRLAEALRLIRTGSAEGENQVRQESPVIKPCPRCKLLEAENGPGSGTYTPMASKSG